MPSLFRIPCVAVMLAVSLVPADNPWAGTYVGDWSSAAGMAKGGFRLTLASAGEGNWKCDVTFTIGEREVKTVTKSLHVAESKIEVSYEFDLADNRLMSTINGSLADGKLEGKYHTKAVPDGGQIDEGTWKAVSKQQ